MLTGPRLPSPEKKEKSGKTSLAFPKKKGGKEKRKIERKGGRSAKLSTVILRKDRSGKEGLRQQIERGGTEKKKKGQGGEGAG